MAKAAKKDQQIPAMDYEEHERTYANFLWLTKWTIIVVTAILVGLTASTIGGMGIIGFILVFAILMAIAYFLF